MQRINLSFLIVLSSLILSGCATKAHFNNTPVNDAEFTKSMPTLEQEYSDIDRFDKFFVSPKESPKLQELKELWGEPKTEKRWGEYSLAIAICAVAAAMGLWPVPVYFIVTEPIPRETYTWEKGNYEITAKGLNNAWVKYEKRIHNWEWKDKNADQKVLNISMEPIKDPRAAF